MIAHMNRRFAIAFAAMTLLFSAPVAHAADLSVTAANVVAGSDAVIDRTHNAGASVSAGQVVYLDSTTKNWKLADDDGASVEIRTPIGIALHAAASGQPLAVQKGGSITIGATMTAGIVYFLSSTGGGICPVADLTTGKYVSLIGVATSTTVMNLNFLYTGVSN